MGAKTTPSEARKSLVFQKLQYEAGELQKKLDEKMEKVNHHFKLVDGGYWCLMASGKFGVIYNNDED